MLVTVILCSVQRKPVANIEAIPTPRRPVPVKSKAEEEAPRTERSSEARRQRQMEAHITSPGLAIWIREMSGSLIWSHSRYHGQENG